MDLAVGRLDPDARAAAGRGARVAMLVYVLAAVATIMPVWAVTYFPSADGPVHLYITFVAERLFAGDEAFARVFELNPYVEPNSTAYALLYLLSRPFGYAVAEKLLVTLYWAAFVAASHYFATSLRRDGGLLAILFLPLGFGYFVHYGFYNFLLSIALALALLGYAIQRLEALGPRQLAVIGGGALLLAVTHLFGFLVFAAVLGGLRVGVAARTAAVSANAAVAALKSLFLDGLKLIAVCLPALLVVLSFYVRHVLADDAEATVPGLAQRLFYIASIAPIFAVDKREIVPFAPYVLTVWALVAALGWRMWRMRGAAMGLLPLMLPIAGLLSGIVIASLAMTTFSAAPRLLPFLFALILLACTTVPLGRRARMAVLAVGAFAAIGSAAVRYDFYVKANALTALYMQRASQPAPGSTLLAFQVAPKQAEIGGYQVGWRVNVLDNVSERYALENGLVHLSSELPSLSVFGYFPVTYRTNADAFAALLDPHSQRLDRLQSYEAGAGVRVDQVEVWPSLEPNALTAAWYGESLRDIRPELAARYRAEPRPNPAAAHVFNRTPAYP